MTFDNQLLNRIYNRAKETEFGLQDEPRHLSFDLYGGPRDFQMLSQILIGAFHGKYDLISIMQAALEIVKEETLKEKGDGHE